jgi:hypothetical protein
MRSHKIPTGKYNVVLRTLAKNNNVFTTVTVEEVSYKAPSIFARIGSALTANPIYLIAIIGIILVLIVFLMISSARQKSMSGTPVLQGRMGGGRGKHKGQNIPAIPVSDQEPIPYRNTAPPGQPPVTPQSIPPQYGVQQSQVPPAAPQQGYAPQSAVPQQSYASQPPVPQTPPVQAYTPQPVAQVPVNTPVSQPAQEHVFETIMQGASETVVAGARTHVTAYLNVTNFPIEIGTNGRVTLDQFPFIVGRTEGNLLIPAPSVSRKHLQITFDPGSQSYFVTDLNSSNGTTVNGQRVTPLQPVQLVGGAMLGLGPSVVVRFELG